MREHSDTVPKSLVPIGERPIIWHLMKYYASYGHKDFILCLGYRGDMIREYFLNYNPYITTDFVMRDGGANIEPAQSDIQDWSISFVDTGLHANIGQRLMAVRDYLAGEKYFLANYSDQVSDLPFNDYLDEALAKDVVASFVSVKPQQSFHSVRADNNGWVTHLESIRDNDVWINGGYMVLRQDIFDYMEAGDELVEAPFDRLIAKNALWTKKYSGFWHAMDTFKDKITLDRMHGKGDLPRINNKLILCCRYLSTRPKPIARLKFYALAPIAMISKSAVAARCWSWKTGKSAGGRCRSGVWSSAPTRLGNKRPARRLVPY